MMIAPPSVVELVGQRFDLVLDDEPLEEDATARVGNCQVSKQRITIAAELADDQGRDTILHEVLHALCRIVGTGLTDDQEERVVGMLAPTLLDALRRNPALAGFLLAT